MREGADTVATVPRNTMSSNLPDRLRMRPIREDRSQHPTAIDSARQHYLPGCSSALR